MGYVGVSGSKELPISQPKLGRQKIPLLESRAIKELSNNHSIVIKPADKGGAVVLWDRQDYVKEGVRQLSNRAFYTETEDDLTPVHTNRGYTGRNAIRRPDTPVMPYVLIRQ